VISLLYLSMSTPWAKMNTTTPANTTRGRRGSQTAMSTPYSASPVAFPSQQPEQGFRNAHAHAPPHNQRLRASSLDTRTMRRPVHPQDPGTRGRPPTREAAFIMGGRARSQSFGPRGGRDLSTSRNATPSWIPPPRPHKRILFYHRHEPHYGFTNFSPHPVKYKGDVYPTSEHLFQSFKFQPKRPNLAQHIRTCSDQPRMAFDEARRFQPEVRPDWNEVSIEKMDEAIYHKFTQHRDLKNELLMTGNAELIENSDRDAFWGCGADGKGRNELGKALERLRERLKNESRSQWRY